MSKSIPIPDHDDYRNDFFIGFDGAFYNTHYHPFHPKAIWTNEQVVEFLKIAPDDLNDILNNRTTLDEVYENQRAAEERETQRDIDQFARGR